MEHREHAEHENKTHHDKVKSAVHFYEQLNVMRLTAAVIYDKCVKDGAKPEIIAKNLEPFSKQVEVMTKDALLNDLPGFVFAIKALENDAKKHERDAAFLIEKAQNSKANAQRLRDALKEDMLTKNSTERMVHDTFVTLIEGELSLR